MDEPRIACVGGLVRDHLGRLLVIRRGTPPGEGLWSVPGGRLHADEDPATGCAREVLEETGVEVEIGALAGRVERAAPGGGTYVIDDFHAVPVAGSATAPRAGDDASDARWATLAELRALPTVPGLLEALAGWDALPR